MNQTLVIQKRLFNSLSKPTALEVLRNYGYTDPAAFLQAIIQRLNDEFAYLEISNYRFSTDQEAKEYSQYGAFIDGHETPYEKIIVFFTPIVSKVGDVVIEQSLMPTICRQMQTCIDFLASDRFKKIVLLTSKINGQNQVDISYNKMQMDVNSLNTLGFDVIPFFPIKNLSTDTRFNSLLEYIEMSNSLQMRGKANSQTEYLRIDNGTLHGYCQSSQWIGEFPKSFCFRFFSAMFAGRNDYNYDISMITNQFQALDNQLLNLHNFIIRAYDLFINQPIHLIPPDLETLEFDEAVEDISDIHRKPEKAIDGNGRKRYKTQKRIRDFVLSKARYLCNCHNPQHFYFESVEMHNYVEGHHIVPMNRQEEYYLNGEINLDIPSNIVPLCPNCHSQIHLGSRKARIKILSEIYVRNEGQLRSFNPTITLSILASYYNIAISADEERDLIRCAYSLINES